MFQIGLHGDPAATEGLLPYLLKVPGGDDGLVLHAVEEGLQVLVVVLALEGEVVLLDALVGEDVLEELVVPVEGLAADGGREGDLVPVLLGDEGETLSGRLVRTHRVVK
jgi:hypothetical protein